MTRTKTPRRVVRSAILTLTGAAALTGCATVDPKPDFDRAGGFVEQSIGIGPRQPDDDAEHTDVLIGELLADGLTSDDAVRIALLNNPHVLAAFQRVGMARADVVQAGLFSNPSLGVTARFPEGGGLAGLDIGLAQNIAELWLIPARRRAAERDLDRTLLESARQIGRIAHDTRLAYFDTVGARQALESARQMLGLVEELHRISQARFDLGSVGALDVNLVRGLVLQAQVDERRAGIEASSAARTLATLMGLHADPDDLNLTEPLPGPIVGEQDAERLVATSLASRLDVQAARDAVEAARENLELEHAAIWRDVEVGIEFEREARRAQPGRKILADTVRSSIRNGELTAPDIQSRSERRAETSREIEATLGPSVSLPLPIFDQNQAQIAKAEFALREALALLDAVEREAAQQTRDALERATAAWDLIRLYEAEVVPQARQTVELSEAAYEAGSTAIVNVIEAQRSLLEVRRAYVAAAVSAAHALVDLERATARPAAQLFNRPDEVPVKAESAPEP